MASSNRGGPTYHVVPRFDIVAPKDPYDVSKTSPALNLGTVVTSLSHLTPLNRSTNQGKNGKKNKLIKLSDLIYPPVTHTSYIDTLSRVRAANGSAWLKFSKLANGGVDLGIDSNITETVECDSIVTTYFDPTPEYVKASLAVPEVQDYLSGSPPKTGVDLYMITGLKVAKNFMFKTVMGKSKEGGVHGELDAGAIAAAAATAGGAAVAAPLDGIGAARAGAHAREENTGDIKHGVKEDIVIAVRVGRYRCTRLWFSKEWKTADQGILDGDMMGDDDDDGESGDEGQFVTEFERVSIPEEDAALEDQSAYIGDEVWVGPPASV
ncbi:hypothetical protein QBC37DRAFT_294702 [Rhypophila decipiens]|uniref:Uncharacterized protein n=1 Tax=Rhypophila decipiens TaxID=261697 RepID=A0AAN7B464_9PEZI|nr:hypothetical protein QBC37DRAFT_294702 [Rhypophila decipiens]